MSASASNVSRSGGQRETLGALWIAYGIVRLILAFWLIFFYTTATLMFGAMLGRVPDPFTLMDVFHFFYIAGIAWTLLSGVFGIFAGLAIRGTRGISRAWFLAADFLALPDIPFGTILGVYTLVWASSFGEIAFEEPARRPQAEIPRRAA